MNWKVRENVAISFSGSAEAIATRFANDMVVIGPCTHDGVGRNQDLLTFNKINAVHLLYLGIFARISQAFNQRRDRAVEVPGGRRFIVTFSSTDGLNFYRVICMAET